MTQTNKTLVCALLALVLVLACALTLPIVAPATANAANGDNYVKVTSVDQLEDGNYLIVYEANNLAFNGGLAALDATNNYITTSTELKGSIEWSQKLENASFDITKSGENYTVRSKSGKYIGNNSDSNSLSTSDSATLLNSITFEENGDVNIVGRGKSVLRYNASDSQTRFRYFKSTTYTKQKAIQLYKLTKATEEHTHNEGDTWLTKITAAEVPTCANAAKQDYYTCSKCGEGKYYVLKDGALAEIAADDLFDKTAAHDYAYTTNNDGTHSGACKNCSATLTNEKCSGGTATCATKAVCDKCGGEYGEVTSRHDYNENDVCKDCGKTISEIQTPIVEAAFALGTGKSLDGTYTLIGKITKINTAYSSSYKNITVTIAVSGTDKSLMCFRLSGGSELGLLDTITVTGTITNYNGTVEFNSDCTYTDRIAHVHDYVTKFDQTNHWTECECGETTTKTAHSWDDGTISKAPTCAEAGETVYKCTQCGATKTESVDATGHSWGDYVSVKEATCTEEGAKERVCSTCGEKDTLPVRPLGHSWGNWTAVDGNKHQRACSRCDETETGDCTTTECADNTYHWQECTVCGNISGKAEHSWDDGTVLTKATCEHEGRIAYACKVCSLGVKNITVPKTDHDYVEQSKTAATCVKEGAVVSKCSYCGDEKTDIVPVDSTNHANIVTDDAVAASCVAEGKTAGSHCADCNTVLAAQTVLPIDSEAHDWGEAKHVDDTETHVYTCKNDGAHTKTEKCTYSDGVCAECGAVKPAAKQRFEVTETVMAGDNAVEKNGKLYVKAGSRIVITYTITANSGVDAAEAVLKLNDKFTFVSLTAGTLDNASITVTGTDVETEVKKAVITAGAGGFTQVDAVMLTVVYELKDGVSDLTDDMAFGMDLEVYVGNTQVDGSVVKLVPHDAKFDKRIDILPTITANGKTASEEIRFVYTGKEITAADFVFAGRDDVPSVQWTDVANAGTYTLQVDFADNGTYGKQTVTFTVVVDKVTLDAADFAISTANGTSLVKKLSGGSVAWTLADFTVKYNGTAIVSGDDIADAGSLVTSDELTLSAPGSKEITITFAGLADGNYVVDGDVTAKFTLTAEKTTLHFEGIADIDKQSKYYDGNEVNVGNAIVKDDNGEVNVVVKVTITKDGVAATEILNAGAYEVTFATALTDEQKRDYDDIATTISYTVNKLTVTDIVFAYDGDVVTWQAVRCYGATVETTTELVAASDVRYFVGDKENTLRKIVADGSAANYVVKLIATDNYIVPDKAATATTAAVRTVTFVDDKHDVATKYVFDGQKTTAIVPATVDKWTFDGWFREGASAAYDFTKAITADVKLTAKWTADVTLTIKAIYDGKLQQKSDVLAAKGNDETAKVNGIANTVLTASWLKFVGYFYDEACTVGATAIKNQNDVTLYAKYVLAIGSGDVDGNGNVTNDDIILYRKLIVGGYKITTIAAGEEFAAALTAPLSGYVLFFEAVADIDESGDGANMRDIATLRMALVEQDGYGIVDGAVVAPSEGNGDKDLQSFDTSIENKIYVVLPVAAFDGKVA